MHNEDLDKDVGFYYLEDKGREFVSRVKDKNPVFLCVLGNTETGKIPGVSAAGAVPEITDYTPAADAELLFLGRCECIDGVPVTPEGIPTPGLITMSALELTKVPAFIVEGGLRVKPNVPYFSLGGKPGADIRNGKAVGDVRKVINEGKILGKNLAGTADFLVIGESIAGGTTTALGVLTAIGINGKVSSSMPLNPMDLKKEIIGEGMKKAGIEFGSLREDPIGAIAALGDPMIPAFSGIVLGAGAEIPILMAGGTQMTAVLAVVAALNKDVLKNLAIGTTKWIVEDRSSDIKSTVEQIAEVPILYSKLSFANSRFPGLRIYEEGIVKEGVGAGGTAILASIRGCNSNLLLERIEENYSKLVDTDR
ncbi:MAG: TIGR00303 family protein [Candidatus Hydrothermarchaeales archaeon]